MTKNGTSSQGLVVKLLNQSRRAPAQPRNNQSRAYTALSTVSTNHKRRRMRAYSLACFCFSGSSSVIIPLCHCEEGLPDEAISYLTGDCFALSGSQRHDYFTVSAASNAKISSLFITLPYDFNAARNAL